MKLLRILLFPVTVLYGIVMSVRNLFFDKNWFHSTAFDVPVIAVGNLSVGGTGKSPQIEYLIRLLKDQYSLATLSRGYGRKTKGYVLATAKTKMTDLGDEPSQFFTKFPGITVAVDENRVQGINRLLQRDNRLEVILLDDAYQHRKVRADFYILLTAYNELFVNDFVIPTGNLREARSGANRSDVVVVTKCPLHLSEQDKEAIKRKVAKYTTSPVFFSTITYERDFKSKSARFPVDKLSDESCLIVAGIAKPESFIAHVCKDNNGHDVLTFRDHHNFSAADIQTIQVRAKGRKIVTTEKDYVRLKDLLPEQQLYYLEIKTEFLEDRDQFDQLVLNVIQNKKATT